MNSRRSFIKQSALLGASSIILSDFFWKALFQGGYRMKALRNNVGIFTERGGTIAWMVDNSGMAVVDTQFPEQASHLIEELKKKSDCKLDLLVNTHHHGDHTAGNIAFKDMVENIMAHENSMLNQRRVASQRNVLDKQLLPTTTYKKGNFSQKVGNEEVNLRYFGPAHTNGDSFVHFENANIVHCGDLMFNRRPPFIDKSAGANIANWQVVLEKGYDTYDNDTLFIYGHSGNGYDVTGKREDLKAFQNYLGKVMEFVKKGAEAGKTKEDLAKVTEIPGAPEWKGSQTRSINAAWTELFEEL